MTKAPAKVAYKPSWIRSDLHALLESEEADYGSMRVRISDLIEYSFLRKRYLRKAYPKMFFIKFRQEDNKIVLQENDHLVDLTIQNGQIYCEQDKTDSCKHVLFALIHPDGPRLWKAYGVIKL